MAKGKRAPVIAETWQLDILRNAHDKNRLTEEKRSVLAAETGLTQEWIKKWWNRQGISRPPAQSPRVPPRQFSSSPAVGPPSTKTTPRLATADRTKTMLPSPPQASRTPSPIFSSSIDVCPLSSLSVPPDHKDIHDPLHLSDECILSLFGDPCLDSWPGIESSININRWSYSRDPLYDRYPDFSQFFLPILSPNKPVNSAAASQLFSPSSHPPYLDPEVQLAWLNPRYLDNMKAQALPVSWAIRSSDVPVLGQIIYETTGPPSPLPLDPAMKDKVDTPVQAQTQDQD